MNPRTPVKLFASLTSLTVIASLAGIPASAQTSLPPSAPATAESSSSGTLSFALTAPDGSVTATAESGIDLLPEDPTVEIGSLVQAPLDARLTTPSPAPEPSAEPTTEPATEPAPEPTVVTEGAAGSMGLVRVLPASTAPAADAPTDGLPDGVADLAPATTTDDLVVLTEVIEPGTFVVAALTWPTDQTWQGDPEINVRVLEGETWSAWLPLEDDDAGVDGEARSGTDPFVTGNAESIQVQINAASLPADLRLEVVPLETASAPQAGGVAAGSTSRGFYGALAPAAVHGDPGVITREEWDANPDWFDWKPVTVQLEGAVVHHTAGSNTYTAAQSAGIVRGIYRYHAIDRGWGDIGYNFLVDKYGQIFEGREGSYEARGWEMVVGGHAAPKNTGTVGVSIMGDYSSIAAPSVAITALVNVINWRFDMAGLDGRERSASLGIPRIAGHRDVSSTICPGPYIYAELDSIRTRVGAAPYYSDFKDVRPWTTLFTPEVNWMKSSRISTGWADGTYRPANSTTRAEFAAFLYRLAGSPAFTPPKVSPFPDIPTTHGFYTAITWMDSLGITSGWEDGTFRPEEPVLRDQVAVFLYRYSNSAAKGGPTAYFADVPATYGFYDAVSWMLNNKIATGYEDRTFRPLQPVTRDELAAFLNRYDAKARAGTLDVGTPAPPDGGTPEDPRPVTP